MLGFFAKLFKHRLHSESKRPTMIDDSFLQLVDSNHSVDTKLFLRCIMDMATVSPDPMKIKGRFLVTGITHCKNPDSRPQHELLILELTDTQRRGEKPLFMLLDRTASKARLPSTNFSEHPDSATICDSIIQTLKEMPAAALSSDDSLPPSAHSQAVDESTPPTPNSSTSQLPFLDTVSLISAKSAHASTHPSSKRYVAVDKFTGLKKIEYFAEGMMNVRQLRPVGLTLFDLAVLADAVHNHDPLYSILKSQCYWFASLICDVVLKAYVCSTIGSKQGLENQDRDEVYIPINNYLPDLAGRWMGILINRVEKAVSSVMEANFQIYLQEKEDEVSFILF